MLSTVDSHRRRAINISDQNAHAGRPKSSVRFPYLVKRNHFRWYNHSPWLSTGRDDATARVGCHWGILSVLYLFSPLMTLTTITPAGICMGINIDDHPMAHDFHRFHLILVTYHRNTSVNTLPRVWWGMAGHGGGIAGHRTPRRVPDDRCTRSWRLP